jgi:glycosyltransferase involved in cell wall biosynthesis
MRLSIVIPTLNEAEHIDALLTDLAPLRAAGHEVILVDGGSVDATRALAASGVDRMLESQRGRAVQMNAGAQIAGGEILWFLHADSRVPPGAAEALLPPVGRGRAGDASTCASPDVTRCCGWSSAA